MKFVSSIAALSLLAFGAAPALADGLAFEGNFAHVGNTDGGEAGIGYRKSIGPVNVTPMVGGFIHDDDVDIYGKLEGTVTIVGIGEAGAGLRIDDDDARPYGTVSFSVLPTLSIKGNVGDDYYAAGLAVRF